jgi:alkylhydroperoxidase family enzyme
MPRIRPLERKETPLVARPFLTILKKMFGKELTPYRVIARRPKILWLTGLLGKFISGTVETRILDLVQLRAAQMIGCPF